jgi:hypothetical protein
MRSMELDLAQLNREVGRLEAEMTRLRIERAAIAKALARCARRRRYLQFAHWVRKPTAAFHLWPLAVLLIGPLVVSFLLLVVASLLVNSTSFSVGSFIVGLFVGFVLFATVLYHPADAQLAPAIQEIDSRWQLDHIRLIDVAARRTAVSDQLQRLLEARRQLAAGEKLQRAMLLQRNWKAMRGTEWEDFIVEVCRTLGAHVERAPNGAYVPPGPTKPVAAGRKAIVSPVNHLIVTISPRRIAVAAVAGISPFHPAAVQQTLNELAQHKADASAIIANTRLTAGSQELAAHRLCTLIGEAEFPDFVLGKIPV